MRPPRRQDGCAVLAGILVCGLLSRAWVELLFVAMVAVLLVERTTQWGVTGRHDDEWRHEGRRGGGGCAVTTAWYRDPTSKDRGAHRGTIVRGRVVTACGGTFPSYGARVEGEPAAEDICGGCRREPLPAAPVEEGQAAVRGARTRRPAVVGPVGAALAGAVLLVLALALVTYLVWPR